ncbi:SidA/IucD/PvdA family monooxygenase [Streptomyces sp. NPDC059740]|uniref:SidA/IucD/PvdA family monooxygenase n=1 Tax=Streptomyces sp. NPDC059740 TaxID=3346926 RepID=UPI0036536315
MTTLDADVLGIGFGPSNIALAIALEEIYPDMKALFLEGQGTAAWQPGMLLSGSDIQHHPVRDLVSPRNPRSHYSFINHLHEEERLFEFLNLNVPFPLRKDYARYVKWAARQFDDQVKYASRAADVALLPGGGVEVTCVDGQRYRARSLVVATGRPAYFPPALKALDDSRVFHYTQYLERVDEIAAVPGARIAVVGGSQGAAEICLDAAQRFPQSPIKNIVRGFGYRQKDLSPFNGEVFFPDFVDYYYQAPQNSKSALDRQLRYTNYSAADIDVLTAYHTKLYEQRLDGEYQIQLIRNTDIVSAESSKSSISLELFEQHVGDRGSLEADFVIVATGFVDLTDEHGENFLPRVLSPVQHLVERTPLRHASIGRDYRIQAGAGQELPPIYLNGLCETTHGLGDAGSFSLVSLRAAAIADSLSKALAS